MKKVVFIIAVFCFVCAGCFLFAENEFSLRLAPSIEVPLNMPQFSPGIGLGASFDWIFRPIAPKFDLGISAGGSVLSLPAEAGDPIFFFEGKAGPFVRFRGSDRWGFFAGLNAGLYQFSREKVTSTKFLLSPFLNANFHLSPYLSLFAEGRYTYRIFTEGIPFPSLGAAIGLRFNLSELMNSKTRLRVEKSEQYRIFPVSWAWYEQNPVAMMKVTNEESNAITDVTLSFFMDSYMGQPYAFAELPHIASGGSADVYVTALFNEVMLGLTDNVSAANGTIQVQYRSLGSRKEAVFPVQMPIFHRNTMSWDDDRRAAAFVSPRDSAARLFARYVENAVDLHQESAGGSSALSKVPINVRYAAAMFEALRLYGMSYVVVPTLSFVNLRADESALDNVTYPYETLYYRGGDCTYLSILYCSLLEVLDIETAFITIPGHLYMAFDVGDNDWMAQSRDILEIDGRRWLPVEVTVPDEGFTRAWRIGARQWISAVAANEAAIFPIRESWKIYPSVTISASVDYPPEMPSQPDIVRAMEKELTSSTR